MTILLVAFAAAAPIPFQLGPAWAEFSRGPALQTTRTKIEVGTLGYDQVRKRPDFWLRRTVVTGIHRKEEVTWTDTRTCAGAWPLIESIRSIPVPRFAPVGSSKGPPIVLDGASYSLRAYSDDGTLTAETNVGTPLAAWIDGALRTLSSCWVKATPERTR